MNTRGAVLLPPTIWHCPACGLRDRTPGTTPNRFHRCRGKGLLAGLTVPLLPEGVAGKVEVREREDYIGQEQVQLHQGRPVMSVVTTRDEGQDTTVFAPVAIAHFS